MRLTNFSAATFAAFATAGLAAAQNDECATALNLALNTPTAFDTTAATLSAPGWPCAASTAPDLWYRVTATQTNTLTISTCGSSYDTALEIFDGTCATLVSLACNDDACGLQSRVQIAATSGTSYFVRVGGFATASGVGTITASHPAAQGNDECATATALALNTAVAFDTSAATQSVPAWPCAATTAPDLWYTYTATSGNQIVVNTCGSSYDTALEVFDGTCAALNSLACNDDSCGLQSQLSWTGVSGTTYFIRVGGFGGASGTGTILVSEQTPPPPLTNNCVESLYASNNFGNVGGMVYFDVTATSAVTITGLAANFTVGAGLPVGVNVYTTPGTYVGNEANMAAWTLMASDNGMGIASGQDTPTFLTFTAPLMLPAGTTGLALEAIGSAHAYTNGTGGNQNFSSVDGVLSLSLGAASNFPFLAPTFTPRVWNGRLCHSGPVAPGTPYCTAVANSTGATGFLNASGSAMVASNDLTLIAEDLPNNAFGFFLTSTTQAFTPNPGGSAGNLCLGGTIGRYVGPGQIKNTGGTGQFSLLLDLTQTPTPTGFVSVMVGDTRNFQAWHRDSVGGSATSNFTNGRSVTFQ